MRRYEKKDKTEPYFHQQLLKTKNSAKRNHSYCKSSGVFCPPSLTSVSYGVAFFFVLKIQSALKTKTPAKRTNLITGVKKKVGNALLSHALERSIIAAKDLNGRVRDGNGCDLLASVTNQK